MADGYPPVEDIDLLLEECPSALLSEFVQMVRNHRNGKATGGAAICFNGTRGGMQDWEIKHSMVKRIGAWWRKRA